jgi:hypothetical protein
MSAKPPKEEIDHHTIKLIVGFVALSLASLTNLFATSALTSISASYYEDGLSRTLFIGFLFAIAAFLFAYNGSSWREMILSRVAALAALGVAMAPCECGSRTESISSIPAVIHFGSAAIMFLVLIYFCYGFWHEASRKAYAQARLRAGIYAVCGTSIALVILVLVIDNLFAHSIGQNHSRLTFYMEQIGLTAFGVSWLAASEVFPIVTRPDERASLVVFGALVEELRELEQEAKKPNLSRQQIDQLSARHKAIAGRMARLQQVESASRILFLVMAALLMSGIVQEMLRLLW